MTTADSHLPPAPNCVAPGEELGRGVFSTRQVRRGRVDFRAFLERPGVMTLSVDRLTHAPPDFAVAKADAAARERPSGAFYGWAVIIADQAAANGRSVQASPPLDGSNPYHADIILPESAFADRDEQRKHAQMLAAVAQWRTRPAAG